MRVLKSIKQLSATWKLIIFYVVALLLIIYFFRTPGFKSGPCTPNLDLLSYILFGLTAALLLARSICKVVAKTGTKRLVALNLGALLFWANMDVILKATGIF